MMSNKLFSKPAGEFAFSPTGNSAAGDATIPREGLPPPVQALQDSTVDG